MLARGTCGASANRIHVCEMNFDAKNRRCSCGVAADGRREQPPDRRNDVPPGGQTDWLTNLPSELGPEGLRARKDLPRRIWIPEGHQFHATLADIRGQHGVRAEAPISRRITGQLIQSGMSAASEHSRACHMATLVHRQGEDYRALQALKINTDWQPWVVLRQPLSTRRRKRRRN